VLFSDLNALLLSINRYANSCLPPATCHSSEARRKKTCQYFSDLFHIGFICISFVGRVASWHQFGSRAAVRKAMRKVPYYFSRAFSLLTSCFLRHVALLRKKSSGNKSFLSEAGFLYQFKY